MQKVEKDILRERKQILDTLKTSRSPVSARDLGTRLRLAKLR